MEKPDYREEAEELFRYIPIAVTMVGQGTLEKAIGRMAIALRGAHQTGYDQGVKEEARLWREQGG